MQQDTLEWILTTLVNKNEKKERIWYIYCKLKPLALAALSFVCLEKKNKTEKNKGKMIMY